MIYDKLDINLLAPLSWATWTASVNKFGRNSDIDTGTIPEDVWDGGGLYNYPTSAQVLQIASTSVNDTDTTGTGARQVVISGLDLSWNEITETISLNGTTAVEGTVNFIRVFRMKVFSCGSGGVNEGIITGTWKTDATTALQINAGNGQTLMAVYTVPANYNGLMSNFYASMNRATNNPAGSYCRVSLFERPDADAANASWQIKHTVGLGVDGSSYISQTWSPYRSVEAKTDIRVVVEDVSDNDVDVSAGFDLALIDLKELSSL